MNQLVCYVALSAMFFVAGCEKKDDGSVEMMTPEQIGNTAEQVAEQTRNAVAAFKVKAEDVMADLEQSVEQVKQKAANLEKNQLQAYIDQYRTMVEEKKGEIATLTDQIKQTSVTDMISEKTQSLRDKLAQYADELEALRERYQIYIDRLKQLGGESEPAAP